MIPSRALIASYLVNFNFFGMASGFSLLFYLPLYLQAVLGQTASQAGLWLLISVSSALTLAGSLGSGFIMQATGKYDRLYHWYSSRQVFFFDLLTVWRNYRHGVLIYRSHRPGSDSLSLRLQLRVVRAASNEQRKPSSSHKFYAGFAHVVFWFSFYS